jgi:hypothetical protein
VIARAPDVSQLRLPSTARLIGGLASGGGFWAGSAAKSQTRTVRPLTAVASPLTKTRAVLVSPVIMKQ